ncbi:cobalamin-dependent protein [Candidatus Solincola tengchongensis]|uniref:B12-binding domain-containing radical SAM protein n=1 Tax=Candidatus Solincola tengchongensis TaxID=2900693 RepID=UPI00257E07A6|nr:cobalamin-dependent protein [Candidatus Solincola tengchongensis]
MRVALVNPNRYLEPPVIPLGLEYLAHYLDREGHEVEVVDLAFTPEPAQELSGRLSAFRPHLVGFSLRNLDTSLYHDPLFFLDEFAELISVARKVCGAPVVVGGTALLAGPREVAEYVGADCAVYGPGERALPHLLRYLEAGSEMPRLVDGWEHSFDRGEVPARGRWVDYGPYLRERGLAGFTTQTGCLGGCDFCLEAGLPWRTRDPRAVVSELASLREAGVRELHLCDCEFNQDLDSCKELLHLWISSGLDLEWSLYMKPLPHDEGLFRLLRRSGAVSVTLSVDSRSLATGKYGLLDLQSFVELARRRDLRVAVDLLVGFPGEEEGEVRDLLDFFRAVRPDTVGVNAWIRVYKYTGMGKEVRRRPPRSGTFLGSGGDPDFLRPLYYNWLSMEKLCELIGEDPLFRVEGLERRSNYERLRGPGTGASGG